MPAQPTDTDPGLLLGVADALQGCPQLGALRLGCHLLPSGCGALGRLPRGLRALRIDCLFGARPGVEPALSAALARWGAAHAYVSLVAAAASVRAHEDRQGRLDSLSAYMLKQMHRVRWPA